MRNLVFAFVLLKFLLSQSSYAQVIMDKPPAELQAIDVQEHLGDIIPMDLSFTDESGKSVRLSEYFKKGRPVILTMAYYKCPMLCTLVLNAAGQVAKEMPWKPGNEYQMVTVSIDPTETPELARVKKENYIKFIGKPAIEDGWHFLTGKEENSKKLADALGFKYYYVEERKEYAHPAVAFILTDEGKIARYHYGIQFKERDVRLSLIEASEGKIGDSIDRLILYCFHYDPAAKGYVLMATNVMKLGGLMTVVLLGGFLMIMWRREIHKKNE